MSFLKLRLYAQRIRVILLFLSLLAVGCMQTIYPWTCTENHISLVVNQPMTPVTCICTTPKKGRVGPDLPSGLTYTSITSGNFQTITISGTPVVGLQKKTFIVGYQEYVSTFTLESIIQ